MTENPVSKIEVTENYKIALRHVTHLVLTDTLPSGGVDVIFYHGRSFTDDSPIIQEVTKIVNEGQAKHILVSGNDGQTVGGTTKYQANIGKSETAKVLDSLGINIWDRVWFSSKDSLHTRKETEAFFQLLVEHNKEFPLNSWRTIGVIAHPHQLPRIMLGTVHELLKRGIYCPVYSTYPANTDWDQKVYGSQGAENKPRKDHIADEFTRIPKYQRQGNLASFEELLNYYAKRGQPDTQHLISNLDLRLIDEAIDKLSNSL